MSSAAPLAASDDPAAGNGSGAGGGARAHVPAMDGWRGLAIMLVLGGHFLALGGAAVLGVELFFVLSGRLMAQILIVREEPLGRFLQRRASRVLPAYLVFVAATSLLAFAAVGGTEAGKDVAFSAAAALFLFSNYHMAGEQLVILFTHTWSLAVEEHSYLLLALIVLAVGRRSGTVLAVVAAAAVAAMANGLWQSLADPSVEWLYARTDIRLASIFASFAMFLALRRIALPPALLPWLCPLGLAGGSAFFLAGASEPLCYTAGTVALALSVNTVEQMAAPLRRVLEDGGLRWLGLVSFSVYLWQQLFYVDYLGGTSAVQCLAGAIACGALSFYGIERPARRYFNALGSPPQPAPGC
jgi:peptidoglycan/LPS O-acetylase OafA/YrhL